MSYYGDQGTARRYAEMLEKIDHTIEIASIKRRLADRLEKAFDPDEYISHFLSVREDDYGQKLAESSLGFEGFPEDVNWKCLGYKIVFDKCLNSFDEWAVLAQEHYISNLDIESVDKFIEEKEFFDMFDQYPELFVFQVSFDITPDEYYASNAAIVAVAEELVANFDSNEYNLFLEKEHPETKGSIVREKLTEDGFPAHCKIEDVRVRVLFWLDDSVASLKSLAQCAIENYDIKDFDTISEFVSYRVNEICFDNQNCIGYRVSVYTDPADLEYE